MHCKIDPNPDTPAFQSEWARVQTSESLAARFAHVAELARQIRGGHIKKIVWDAEGGYPEHAWGYVQYSPRPYCQGYGCDGTTDENIHLVAATLCARLGIGYAAAYAEAYPDDTTPSEAEEWLAAMLGDPSLAEETAMPDGIDDKVLSSALRDLHEINNHLLAEVLEEKLRAAGHPAVPRLKRPPGAQATNPPDRGNLPGRGRFPGFST